MRAQSSLPPLSSVNDGGQRIFESTKATALVVVVVRKSDVYIQTYGETAPGNGREPDSRSVIRLCSITKVFTADVLAQLVAEQRVRLNDTLQQYAPKGDRVPSVAAHTARKTPITLLELATHTAGLPREIGATPEGAPHFTYPDSDQRWAWLQRAKLLTVPGTTALYSNVSFDFLADALQVAAQTAYPTLLKKRILDPLAMRDTTFEPTRDQCGRLLMSGTDQGPCTSTVGTDGSSGLYSTAADVARWLRYLIGDPTLPIREAAGAQASYLTPAQLRKVNGLDHAGKPSGIGLAWLRLGAAASPSMILEKTGGGAGFHTYVALTPAEHTAIFIAFTEGHDTEWHGNPHRDANNMLLALSNLPPMSDDAHRPKRRVRRAHLS